MLSITFHQTDHHASLSTTEGPESWQILAFAPALRKAGLEKLTKYKRREKYVSIPVQSTPY
jgi:hypothetical protein